MQKTTSMLFVLIALTLFGVYPTQAMKQEASKELISIKGIYKPHLLMKLYYRAINSNSKILYSYDAVKIIEETEGNIDCFRGCPIKIDLFGDMIDPRFYNRKYGKNVVEKTLIEFLEEENYNQWLSDHDDDQEIADNGGGYYRPSESILKIRKKRYKEYDEKIKALKERMKCNNDE